MKVLINEIQDGSKKRLHIDTAYEFGSLAFVLYVLEKAGFDTENGSWDLPYECMHCSIRHKDNADVAVVTITPNPDIPGQVTQNLQFHHESGSYDYILQPFEEYFQNPWKPTGKTSDDFEVTRIAPNTSLDKRNQVRTTFFDSLFL